MNLSPNINHSPLKDFKNHSSKDIRFGMAQYQVTKAVVPGIEQGLLRKVIRPDRRRPSSLFDLEPNKRDEWRKLTAAFENLPSITKRRWPINFRSFLSSIRPEKKLTETFVPGHTPETFAHCFNTQDVLDIPLSKAGVVHTALNVPYFTTWRAGIVLGETNRLAPYQAELKTFREMREATKLPPVDLPPETSALVHWPPGNIDAQTKKWVGYNGKVPLELWSDLNSWQASKDLTKITFEAPHPAVLTSRANRVPTVERASQDYLPPDFQAIVNGDKPGIFENLDNGTVGFFTDREFDDALQRAQDAGENPEKRIVDRSTFKLPGKS